jgi:uncharacterized membrane protein YgcG
MAVPGPGNALSLAKIRDEIENNNYNANLYGYTSGPTSLQDISNGTYDTINTNNASANRPDGSAPHSMSEFYSYDHDLVSITQIGLTYSGAYSCSSWQNVSISLSAYKGNTVRFIWHYVSGSDYRGDLQIDEVKLPSYNFGQNYWTQTTYPFNTNTSFNNGGFQTNTNNSSSFSAATLATVTSGTTGGRWNGRSGSTPSGGTGLSSGYGGSGWYVYAETSGNNVGYPSRNFWLVSPYTFLPNYVGTPYFGFRLGRCGATIGTLKIYIDA